MSLNKNYFLNYPNPVFVETGSYHGDAIQYAIECANISQYQINKLGEISKVEFLKRLRAGKFGFECLISIDIDQTNIDFCYKRFDQQNEIYPLTLIRGDSANCLWDAIKDIKKPITFWLDSHWQLFENEPKGKNPFPLLEELKQISWHPIKTHTILIDDMLIMQKDIVGYDKQDIEAAILAINPDYKISYLPNPVVNGILVAQC